MQQHKKEVRIHSNNKLCIIIQDRLTHLHNHPYNQKTHQHHVFTSHPHHSYAYNATTTQLMLVAVPTLNQIHNSTIYACGIDSHLVLHTNWVLISVNSEPPL